MPPLPVDRYLEALTAHSKQFVEALQGADLQQRVSTCPEWTIYQLIEHLVQSHRWATAIVARRVFSTFDPREGRS